jgi:hypothetical protein
VRFVLISCCLFLAAGALQEGVTLRTWNETGDPIDSSHAQPGWYLGFVGILLGLGLVFWLLGRVGTDTERSLVAELLFEACEFAAGAGILIAIIVAFGMARAQQTVAPAYRWFLAGDVLIAAAGLSLVLRSWRRQHVVDKPALKSVGIDRDL